MKQSPCDGGCWFCYTDEETKDWLFSYEFDCNLHEHCLIQQINDKGLDFVNPDEDTIIAKELGYVL